MKWITAFIRPHRLDDVRMALAAVGVAGLTVTETIGFGSEPGWTEVYRGASYHRDDQARLTVEVCVTDELSEPVVDAISNIARTGRPGDGKIIVRQLTEAIRVRTQEQGNSAL